MTIQPDRAALPDQFDDWDASRVTEGIAASNTVEDQTAPRPAEDQVALLVSGSPCGVSPQILKELAGQVDFVLAVDSGANQLQRAGIIPDLLVGDLDSIDSASLADLEAKGARILRFDAYKNATDMELALMELHTRGYRRCIATNVLGARNDHALGSIGALAYATVHYGIEIVIRDENELCYLIDSSGGERALELSFEEDATGDASCSSLSAGRPLLSPLPRPRYASLFAWGKTSTVSISGTEWLLDHFDLSPYQARGVSNEVKDSELKLEVHGGEGVVLLFLEY